MAYLDNNKIIVDAVLTKKGRELLAKGAEFFKITQFALSDDEIDYTLYDPSDPRGSDYYASIIENLPILEAFTDETQLMKYKLVTLPKSTFRIPIVTVPTKEIILSSYQAEAVIVPQTTPPANTVLGYTATLHNSDACELIVQTPIPSETRNVISRTSDMERFQTEDQFQTRSVSAIGLAFVLRAKLVPTADIDTQLTIVGNETGGSTTVNVKVLKNEQSNPAAPVVKIIQ